MHTVLVYSTQKSFRLKYVLSLVFVDLLGIAHEITQDINKYKEYNGPKLNYSENKIESKEIFIKNASILFQKGIKEQNLQIGDWRNEKILFHWQNGEKIPFDIFAAIFYLITRYEEYLPHISDHYNRFEVESSIAHLHKFIERPVINIWINNFKNILGENFSTLKFIEPKYKFISTIDVDNAFAFTNKGVMRTIGGYMRAIVNLNWTNLRDRTQAIFKLIPDPFDSYKYQLAIQKKYKIEVIYFFLLGDYGINDKNLPSNNKTLQSLIKHLGDYAKIGIHPSFGSNENSQKVKKEINRLAIITHRVILNSRQHFARLHFPTTYKALIENGIQNDYSMGYHNHIGFRASISTPFYWYDLDSETETNLKVYPYLFSESTLKFAMKLKPEYALIYVKKIIDEVKNTGGTFVSIFDNESLGNYGQWENWKKFYEEIIIEALS